MGMSIYAGKIFADDKYGECMGPVFDFKTWEPTCYYDDEEFDRRLEAGEPTDYPNPDYIPNAGFDLSERNARTLFETLGFEINSSEGSRFDIQTVQRAAMRALNGHGATVSVPLSVSKVENGPTFYDCGIPEGYISRRCEQLIALIAAGRRAGATHLVVA